MKRSEPIFRGCATALITPFRMGKKETLRLDFDALERLIERQIDAGNAILLCGTTGESASLSDKEKIELLRVGVKLVAGRVPLLFGSGSNDTAHAVALTKEAEAAGADAALLVTPYYNKATPEGLFRHYEAIANATALPLLLYHVPSRTGLTVSAETLRRIGELPGVVACKEASADMGKVTESMAVCRDLLDFYCGNDDLTLPELSLGAVGVISVTANILPEEVAALCRSFGAGKTGQAIALHEKLLPLTHALFREVNPIPVKWLLSRMGFCAPLYRLPLSLPCEGTARLLETFLPGIS